MKNLITLYPYLSEGELRGRFNEGVRILLKVKRFSHKIAAGKFILTGIENKDAEVLNFFTSYKREKAPVREALQDIKTLHASMPANSKLTIEL